MNYYISYLYNIKRKFITKLSLPIFYKISKFANRFKMESICAKIKSDSDLDENPVKKLKLSDSVNINEDKRTVATMCGAWRPEEEDGGLIFVFKTRTPALSPDPTKECDYPENIEDFWDGSLVNVDIIQVILLIV